MLGVHFGRVLEITFDLSCSFKFECSQRFPGVSPRLQDRPTMYQNGTLAQCTGRAFFCQTSVSSARPSGPGSHVIIVKAHRSCFQNASLRGILDFLSILAKLLGSTCISGNIFDYTFTTLCRGVTIRVTDYLRESYSESSCTGSCASTTVNSGTNIAVTVSVRGRRASWCNSENTTAPTVTVTVT